MCYFLFRFFLHFSCAMLPTIVRHRNHKHLRILRYSPIEGEVEDASVIFASTSETQCTGSTVQNAILQRIWIVPEIRGSRSSLVAPPMNMSLIHTLSLWLK